MRVAQLSWTAYRIPFRQPFATSQGTEAERRGFVVRLVTHDGREGLGEAAPVPGSGPRVWTDVASLLEALSPRLQGAPLEAVNAALRTLDPLHPAAVAAVRCGLDTAACDVLSQAAGMPLARWLAGARRQERAGQRHRRTGRRGSGSRGGGAGARAGISVREAEGRHGRRRGGGTPTRRRGAKRHRGAAEAEAGRERCLG